MKGLQFKLISGFILISIIFFLAECTSDKQKNNADKKISLENKRDSIKNASNFVITGRLVPQDGSIDSTLIELFDLENNSKITELRDTAKFSVNVKFDKTYRIDFSKPGYFTKKILINTQIPDSLDFNYPPLSFIVNLFEYDSINSQDSSIIVGKVFYNAEIDNFDTEIFFN